MTDAGWTEVRWRVPAYEAEVASEALGAATDGSVVVEDDGADAVLVAAVEAERDTPRWREELCSRLGSTLDATTLAFSSLADQDWRNAWRDVWRPFRVRPFAIVPHHHQGALRPDDVRLVLEPGASFGTGRHATTRACLRAVGELDVAGARVLDAGFGSGVLGVAAALRGAAHVDGFDVDRHARRAAEELARDNGVSDRCEFRAGGFDVLNELEGPWDLVLANIYHDVVETRAAELAGALAPGGTLVVSGCRRERRTHVRDALERAGLVVTDEVGVKWRTFRARRTGA